MIRILHITGGMKRAGAETLLMNLYRNINRDDFQFDFLYFTDEPCDYDQEIIDLGGRIYRIPPKSRNRVLRIVRRYLDYIKLIKGLNEHQIVHSHINLNGAFFLWLAKRYDKKIRVSHSHISKGKKGVIPGIYRALTRNIILKSANIYMACGEAAGEYLYPKVTNDKVIVFPNSIDISSFQSYSSSRTKLHEELKLDSDKKIILQIGRFTYQKNFEFTIDFIEHLKKKQDNFHFVFLGTGPLEDKLKAKVTAKNLDQYVTFYGISSEIPAIMHSSDIFFMPSNLEGFPVVLVEAQACGLPCIISTNISSEVDMGLNLITFLDLNCGFDTWESKLNEAFGKKSFAFDTIKAKMSEKNFNAADSAIKLQNIYMQKLKND
ncbi:glycosyltransferase family 1 protein [Flagellimonas aequoris]|uniref:Glycosyltransferase family 1 protein n=1 Tax=Flagellimonas aequoris TaxID=2306997 RepID=A0A418NBY7_9FLAO|nr:glycosyltransferase family 1 protein [Allomuricauda aequoris]RIV74388.1 glycosyltransferase family 1 protein [Allomuricauda aequoris]TXK08510.1 glycosyltransferase family 1 protein [Allomuricauda aequoris]